MSPAEAATFVEQAGTVILATIGPDGVPDPVAMWFVVRDGDVWMRTYAKSQKAVNLRRDARVSVLIENGTRGPAAEGAEPPRLSAYSALRGVQITGRIELVDDVEVICDIAAGLMVKYEGVEPEHVPALREAYRPTAPKQVAMRLIAERTVSWDHAKLTDHGRHPDGKPSG